MHRDRRPRLALPPGGPRPTWASAPWARPPRWTSRPARRSPRAAPGPAAASPGVPTSRRSASRVGSGARRHPAWASSRMWPPPTRPPPVHRRPWPRRSLLRTRARACPCASRPPLGQRAVAPACSRCTCQARPGDASVGSCTLQPWPPPVSSSCSSCTWPGWRRPCAPPCRHLPASPPLPGPPHSRPLWSSRQPSAAAAAIALQAAVARRARASRVPRRRRQAPWAPAWLLRGARARRAPGGCACGHTSTSICRPPGSTWSPVSSGAGGPPCGASRSAPAPRSVSAAAAAATSRSMAPARLRARSWSP
mmetsp:Transcript_6166/g.16774  ORF Transcript_6166/g.16774 Transcript_6166/m.16774 type:complete len:308 (+) Transcript_6166:603-1526(+)